MENQDQIQDQIQAFMEQEKANKVERYRRLNKFVRPGQILFVGSSLMEQFPVNELLMDLRLPYTVYNRGIGGFTTTELMEVLDVCVYALNPAHIFINIGTNDLNGPEYTLSGLMERYEAILTAIKAHLPEAKLHLLAYYPMCEKAAAANPFMAEILQFRNNVRVSEANEGVKALAEKMGASFHDCNAGITDGDGDMKPEYTIEGMHMYGDGYYHVLQALLPVLKEIAG